MNNHPTTQEEKVVSDFLKKNAITVDENKWFTHRVMHQLPPAHTTPGRSIMAIITFFAVVMCCFVLWYVSQHFSIPRENNITANLLCIYIAIMSSVLLVTLQVIRFIKTYF